MRAIAAANIIRIQEKEVVKKTISEIVKKYCEMIPFNHDYSSLNWLAYLPQEELRLNQLLKNPSLSDEQKEKIQSGLRDIDQGREKNQATFSAIISDHLNITAKIAELTAQQAESRKVIDDDTANDLAVNVSASQFEDAEQELKAIKKIIPNINTLRESSEWQKLMFAEFLKTHSNLSADFLVLRNQFISFLLEKNKAHFPEEYQPDAAAKINFPSSNKNMAGLGHLDMNGRKKILAISAPMKSDTLSREIQNQITLNNFEKTLIKNNIKRVICLGTSAKHPNRLNYKEILKKNNIELIEIDVEDNTSLNFSNNQLRTIISAYKKQDEIDAVHCDSGVGRTGQLRLLFALLNLTSSNFRKKCDALIEILLNPADHPISTVLVEKYIDDILKKISETLAELRQIRYCVQSKDQFSNTLAQLLLLIAAQNNYTDEQLNTIRKSFDVSAPLENVVTKNDSENSDDEIPTVFDVDIDSLASLSNCMQKTPITTKHIKLPTPSSTSISSASSPALFSFPKYTPTPPLSEAPSFIRHNGN